MRTTTFLLGAALVALPLLRVGAQTRQEPPTPAEIKAIAREMQEKQRERERLSDRKELIPLETLAAKPTFAADPQFAYLRLTNEMDTLRAIWTLLARSQAEGERPEPIVTPLSFRGDQWLKLEPGAWMIQLETGNPASDLALTMAPRAIELKAGRAYALEMTEQTEQQLRKILEKMAHPAPSDPSADAFTQPLGNAPAETQPKAIPAP